MRPTDKIHILGIWFNALTIPAFNTLVVKQIKENRKTLIANHNLHSVFLFHFRPGFNRAFELADFVLADGMPLILWARIKRWCVTSNNRVTSLDFYESLFSELNKIKGSVFYLGGKAGVAQAAVENLKLRFPQIKFDFHHGYFECRGHENELVLEKINRANPSVLFVGMGMPQQENWISENFPRLPTSVVLPCGAFFDYLAGAKKSPPRWLSKFYLEWFYRFVCEPKRLFGRYFVEPVFLIPVFIKDLWSPIKPGDGD